MSATMIVPSAATAGHLQARRRRRVAAGRRRRGVSGRRQSQADFDHARFQVERGVAVLAAAQHAFAGVIVPLDEIRAQFAQDSLPTAASGTGTSEAR
jgi:hypothetical protein